jgi:hypothetical protein
MHSMRSINWLISAAILLLASGCWPAKYGEETQFTLHSKTRPVWAIAPAINLSGVPQVDPLLQADLLYEQVQDMNNVTVIPVNRVIEVYAALGIAKVESQDQAAVVCEQLGADALVIPTVTVFDPYDPPKVGAALQLLGKFGNLHAANVDPRELSRLATPGEQETLPANPGFIQAVGMYDAANGSVRDAVQTYAKGRNDPTGPLGAKEYFVSMDRYCGFVYHSLLGDMLRQMGDDQTPKDEKQKQAVAVAK